MSDSSAVNDIPHCGTTLAAVYANLVKDRVIAEILFAK